MCKSKFYLSVKSFGTKNLEGDDPGGCCHTESFCHICASVLWATHPVPGGKNDSLAANGGGAWANRQRHSHQKDAQIQLKTRGPVQGLFRVSLVWLDDIYTIRKLSTRYTRINRKIERRNGWRCEKTNQNVRQEELLVFPFCPTPEAVCFLHW